MDIIIEEFLKKVNKTDTCWLWTGSERGNGYGNYKKFYAHRASYELFKGQIPKGLFVCHSCDNRKCVNPEHLWVGTIKDNTRDMINKGRGNLVKIFGKLTEKQVLEIREKQKLGYTTKQLSVEYSVIQRTIKRIFNREIWKHLT